MTLRASRSQAILLYLLIDSRFGYIAFPIDLSFTFDHVMFVRNGTQQTGRPAGATASEAPPASGRGRSGRQMPCVATAAVAAMMMVRTR